ncbi:MAG: ORF6N domain-containing protein [Opitutus sp.]|nr:ORF6N domain-containing protein [Opitutus sp.]
MMRADEPKITPYIRTIRDQRVILDADLAALYGVRTMQFNQAFKRNRDRFPSEFAFQLNAAEFVGLNWSQTVTSPRQDAAVESFTSNSSQTVMSSRKHRGATYRPWAFTEHGALMAANILRSPRAREMSVFIIRAFLRMREELASNVAILKRLAEIDRTLLVHDSALRDVYQKLLPLLEPSPNPRRPPIGFHPGNR